MTTTYRTWGADGIDAGSFDQMNKACELPVAVAGALMPDAHVGYGLPIGGVLALDNAVCPFAVGVDIACRMKLSVFAIEPALLLPEAGKLRGNFSRILEEHTFFGIGVENGRGYDHPVLDRLPQMSIKPIRENAEKFKRQLGTSGSGNHFAEFGVLSVPEHGQANKETSLPPGQYVALMTHSGSRGSGAAVCDYYSRLAKAQRPEFGDLAWLDLGKPAGDEYWEAMNYMGEYAAANHDCIHREIAVALGIQPFTQIENHHNFAWKERHGGREVIVHRKGATPAGKGVLGVIPGSMGTPAYVVQGKGSADSLCSASHGAGRVMSRKQAKRTFDYRTEMLKLAERGITILSAGADEVCGVYKDIEQVMAAQTDLVLPVAKFEPRIVKMAGGGRAED